MRLFALCLGLLLAVPVEAHSVGEGRCGPVRAQVRSMASWNLLCQAVVRAGSKLPEAEARELVGMLTPEALLQWTTMTTPWMGPQQEPVVEEVVDKALHRLRVAPGTVPAPEVAYALWSFVNEALLARREEDLEEAGSALAWAARKAGVKVVAFILTRQMMEPVVWLDRPPSPPKLTRARKAALAAEWEGAAPVSTVADSEVTAPTCGGQAVPPGWPELSSSREVLAPFLACSSPAEFIELQRRVDMVRLVERLDDWSAVRLGALGPLVAGAEVLNGKRAAFLATAPREYGPRRAQVFALFLIHTAFTDELEEVLRGLAQEKRLRETFEGMETVREALGERGLKLEDYKERPEQGSDVLRGLAGFATEALSTSELRRGAVAMKYSVQRGDLPEPYQEALDRVEAAELADSYTSGEAAVAGFDTLTFGVPMGFYHLGVSTRQGMKSLSQGHYEQATRELTATVLVAWFAGGKLVRMASAAAKGKGWIKAGPLELPQLSVEGLAGVAERMMKRLGGEGMVKLAEYIRARREAALLVCEWGEAGAMALYEARGNVAKARAWMAEALPEGTGSGKPMAGARKAAGGLTLLVDDAAGYTREVVEAKFALAELESTGARLSGDIAALEKMRPSVGSAPPGAAGSALWSEYVAYWENRLAELKQGKATKPPLKWEAYEQMRGLFARGLAFERVMVELLRADAKLPRAQRLFLKDFDKPRIETNVGVSKPGIDGIRYADVLVIEEAPMGQPPRVETFSFKSRDLRLLKEKDLSAQIMADASDAMQYYGGALDIRRRSLALRGSLVQVQKVHLVYEGTFKPKNSGLLERAVNEVQDVAQGVEVEFQ